MNLSTEVKTHVVKTYSGGTYFINNSQHQQLTRLGVNDNITLEGCIIKGRNISEILTTAKYYEMHPDKRPVNENYTYNNFSERETYQGYASKHLTSKERLEKALKTWKRQRDNGEVEIQTGGLQHLIDWAEEKLQTK